jgi:dimethylhistidine N-methyltransferase
MILTTQHAANTDSSFAFASDVRDGLSAHTKRIPSKYLYDAVGSALFEEICGLPEYGVSRAGDRLLEAHARELTRHLAGPLRVIELGPGSGKKLHVLLDGIGPGALSACAAVDVSPTALACTRAEIAGLCGDRFDAIADVYRHGLRCALGRREAGERALVVFLGSNLGNYERGAAVEFLGDVRAALEPGDALLLGLDLVKPETQLIAAYDDPLGVTAAFDMNLLARINRELGGCFDPDCFHHEARWRPAQQRIEMHLVSELRHTVSIRAAGLDVFFDRGETIWTESSEKYRLDEIAALGRMAGFRLETQWVDREWPFVHALLVADGASPAGIGRVHAA